MTPEAVTRTLCEFIITYIHAVSYVAGVYPRNTYRLVRQYDTATYQCVHNGVITWIENAAKSAMQLLYESKGCSPSVILSIVVLENGVPIERFGIDFAEYETRDTPASQSQPYEVNAYDVSEQFRSCLVRLYSSEHSELKDDCNRSMSLFFEGGTNMIELPASWFRIDGKHAGNTNRLVPIRSIEINNGMDNVLVLNTFRQSAAKNSIKK